MSTARSPPCRSISSARSRCWGCAVSTTWPRPTRLEQSGSQWAEEGADLLGQRRGLLQRGEVAAARHLRPAPQISVLALGQRARRPQDLAWKLGVAGGHLDARIARPRKARMLQRMVRREG